MCTFSERQGAINAMWKTTCTMKRLSIVLMKMWFIIVLSIPVHCRNCITMSSSKIPISSCLVCGFTIGKELVILIYHDLNAQVIMSPLLKWIEDRGKGGITTEDPCRPLEGSLRSSRPVQTVGRTASIQLHGINRPSFGYAKQLFYSLVEGILIKLIKAYLKNLILDTTQVRKI